MGKKDGLTGKQSSPFPDPNVLPDILGSGPASEGGYDSDAQGITTPRVEPSIADSTGMSVENLDSHSNCESKNVKGDPPTRSQEVCSRDIIRNAENIKEAMSIDPVPGAKPPSKCLIPEAMSPERTPKTNQNRHGTSNAVTRIPSKDGTRLNVSRPKVGVNIVRASRASEPAEPSEKMSSVFPQRSSSSATPIPHRQVSIVSQSIRSPLGPGPKPFDHVSFAWDTSDSQDRALNTADTQTHQREASSIYPSHPNSLPSSPGSSAPASPPPIPRELYSIDATASLNEATTAAPFNGPTSTENNPISSQKRESSIFCSETQDWVQYDTLLLSNGPSPGQPTQSRFTEQLESPKSKHGNITDSQRRNRERRSDSSRKTSDGWLSGGRRQGYGYEFVSEADEDTNIMWKRAMKAHAEEGSVRSRRRSQNSFTWKGKKRFVNSSRDGSSEDSGMKQDPAPPDERASIENKGKIPAPGIGVVMSKKEKGTEKSPARSLRKWANFPSHSRAERCASAGTTDNVTVRDFSSTQDQRSIPEDYSSTPQVDGQVERETPRKSGREWFRQWTKLARQSNIDLRRYRAGHRAEVSRSGLLKYPELELIPDGPQPYVVMEELGNVEKASKEFLRRQKEQTKAEASPKSNVPAVREADMPNTGTGAKTEPLSKSDSRSDTGTENEFVLAPVSPLTPDPELASPLTAIGETVSMEPFSESISAQMWSRLYEDCVKRPTSDNGGDVFSLASVPSSRAASPEQARDQRLTAISTSMDLHSSTADFKEFQLADEVKTRDSLMRMVEAAWGSGLSDRGAPNASQRCQEGDQE